jgi:hypothetical protein
MNNKKPTREVFNKNALHWLQYNEDIEVIITSLPDMSELNATIGGWKDFTKEACERLIDSLSKDGIIFFYQTDRKLNGTTIDKKSFISRIFHDHGFNTVLSKIVLKQKPETINLFRPTFTNLFAFSKVQKGGKATADVIYAGEMIYKNAMGLNACKICIDYVKNKGGNPTIVDPFCGQGSVLKMANDNGFNAIGVDIDEVQTKKAILL